MAHLPGGGAGRTGAGAGTGGVPSPTVRHSTQLPGISSTAASMLRTRRAAGMPSALYTDEQDAFEVETPGDAALNELPAGIIMPRGKSARAKGAKDTGTSDAQTPLSGSPPAASRPTKTLKAPGPARAPFPRAPAPKLPAKPAIGGPALRGIAQGAGALQLKGTPARVQRYSLPVRAEKPVRTSKVSGRHVLLPDESQLAPVPLLEDEEDEDADEDDEEESEARLAPQRLAAPAVLRPPRRKMPVFHTFERMSPQIRAHSELPRITSYAISASIHIPTLLAFLRREHGVRPRLYEGCAYALYFKPLLPGFGRATVRSSREPETGSPGAESRHEREIQKHEESGYVGSYFAPTDGQQNMDTQGFIGQQSMHSSEFIPDPGTVESVPIAPPDPTQADRAGAQDMLRAEEGHLRSTESEAPLPEPAAAPLRINAASHTHDMGENDHAPVALREALRMGELVVLPYGVVVMFNFTRQEEASLIEDVIASGSVRNMYREYDSELFHFCYDPNVGAPRIFNDFFTFRAPNHLLKISLAHAIAQSTKLSEFEESMRRTLELTSHIPRELAQTGELRVNRRGALRMSGHLFKLRVDVNLTSDVLDTPDLFWNEASLQALYLAIREYLEIDARAQTLNERLAVASDLLEIIHEHLNNNAMSKITWIIIALIVAACFVGIGEVSARMLTHARRS
ncbi:Sad1-interacting factor 3 [Malassezia sp. CBS 17886]|nr:Sad1-interacting factor 3 [Malassezia sp. CBS 17886]